MRWAPVSFSPSTFKIHNGTAASAAHVKYIDAYATWLASVHKFSQPVSIGAPLDSTNTATAYPMAVWIDPYSRACGFRFWCTGAGDITIGLTNDTYTASISVSAPDSTNHNFINAAVVQTPPAQDNVSANGLERSLDVALSNAPMRLTATIQIANKSGSTLKIHAIQTLIEPPPETEVLP